MLKTRVLTAIVMLLVFVPALLWAPPAGWLALVASLVGAGAFEWARIKGVVGAGRVVYAALLALLVAVLGFAAGNALVIALCGVSVGFWCVVAPCWLRFRWRCGYPLGLLVGAVLLLPSGLALVKLREIGPGWLVGVMVIVWLADSGAYFAGRAFGRRKLAPSISPGKSWEGVIGGVVAVLVYGVAINAWPAAGLGLAHHLLVPALLVLTALSIIGDLFESMVKREAGVKDSGRLLPGHGGVLDRIDSLTSTLPLAFLLFHFLRA